MITDIQKHEPFRHMLEPMEHQAIDLKRSMDMEYFGFFWEMGTGKSKPILDTAMHLFLKQEIDGVLIVADKGCYLNWYYDQIPIHLSSDWPKRFEFWSSRMDRRQEWKTNQILKAKDDCLDFAIINVESLSHDRGFEFAEAFLRSHYSMMVIDESTSIKNLKAARTKACIKLGKLADYRRIASGTPITQSPLDLFSQCEFLKPGLLGFNSFVAFKSYYAITQKVNSGRGWYENILGYRNLELLTKSIQPFSSRRLKSECLDLPPKLYETYYVEQTPEQKEAYRKLKQEALLQFDNQLITITSALTLLGKLHQINLGHVKDDDGSVIRIPSNRADALLDLLANIPGKAVIWGHYQEDIRIISERLHEVYGPGSYVQYYGETASDERAEGLLRFRDDPSCRWFVGTPATGGKGINGLTVASHMIYYANHYNLERRLQSEDRIHRKGQKNECTYIDMCVAKTVDVEIVKALKAKKDLATQVLDGFRMMLTLDELPF
jgi:SNF2 family DNA or RNA helicase